MVGEGDMILSPIFDKSKTLHFVVLGELPGRYNREMATKILESHGVKIDSKVTVATDFVVLGMKDGEDADPAESEDYKKAQGWSIPVLRARDLEPFLQF
jgi:NAD-dependent DNA ligase